MVEDLQKKNLSWKVQFLGSIVIRNHEDVCVYIMTPMKMNQPHIAQMSRPHSHTRWVSSANDARSSIAYLGLLLPPHYTTLHHTTLHHTTLYHTTPHYTIIIMPSNQFTTTTAATIHIQKLTWKENPCSVTPIDPNEGIINHSRKGT